MLCRGRGLPHTTALHSNGYTTIVLKNCLFKKYLLLLTLLTFLLTFQKGGPLKQIVPQYKTLKDYYTLLWDMPSNEGYINIVSVMQKFFDQAISGNWSYNPENYDDNEVPVSVMANDLLTTYKCGWKTSYYQNTYDIKTDEVVEEKPDLENLLSELSKAEEGECESCAV